jgi:hypothetical protein
MLIIDSFLEMVINLLRKTNERKERKLKIMSRVSLERRIYYGNKYVF